MKEFIIDLFCGAGGTSEGIHLANCDSTVTACVIGRNVHTKNKTIMEKFKPYLLELIKYYYEDLGNGTGGYLHIVLDDGNIEHENINWCQNECEKHGDSFGVFLADVLMQFTEDELEDMYYDRWWKMQPKSPTEQVHRLFL